MTGPRHRLAELLRQEPTGGSFSTRRTAPPRDLKIDVRGLGPIRFPVTAAQAKEVRMLARPARYGKGEQTLFDRTVRDTWEVPRSRVTIDKRQWANTLRPLLNNVRGDLGLPETSSLKAELHSLLVYEPGQFFDAHQDSEKHDPMIGTLIVLLPSRSDGGELVVNHRGRTVTYTGSASSLTFVAFYADTRHEVRPVTRGYRVALTYNLLLAGSSTPSHPRTPALDEPVAALLRQHFAQPSEPRRRGNPDPVEPPDRLVFLLDHQYSEHSVRWTHLKGVDAGRGESLRRAAEHAACETALVLVEIKETWDCDEPAPRHRHRWWNDAESDDDESEDDESDDDPELGDLLESTVTITTPGDKTQRLAPDVTDAELATSTPTASLAPYDTEFTGNMGNWGNTMDRWYRRAAVVVWPHARSFAVKAKADPLGATEELLAALTERPSDRHVQNEMVATLLRHWTDGVRRHGQTTLLPSALLLATKLDDPSIAARLLDVFEITTVTPTDASALLNLDTQYGRRWFNERVMTWMKHRRQSGSEPRAPREKWTQTLPALCAGFGHSNDPLHANHFEVAGVIVTHTWTWLKGAIDASTGLTRPSARKARMHDLAPALLAVLHATSIAGDQTLRQQIVTGVSDHEFRHLPLLLHMIDADISTNGELEQLGVVQLAQHCAEALRTELTRPERAAGNWSIVGFASGDGCEDCTELAGFLANATQRQLVWPLAKPRRQHLHICIDDAELPLTHRTTREGSPHKLVITKTTELFTRDTEQRAKTRASLAAIERLLRIRQADRPTGRHLRSIGSINSASCAF